MKKIVIINGNPDKESFCRAIHQSYKKGAFLAGHEVEEIVLADMTFSPNLPFGYRKSTELEQDLLDAIEKMKWADHIVWIYPIWWGTVPAILKGFIDRVFLPGIAYQFQENKSFPKPLFLGKTSEIIGTLDTPVWYYKLFYKDIGGRMLRKNVGAFCGIKNKRTTYFSVVRKSSKEKRIEWLNRIERQSKKI